METELVRNIAQSMLATADDMRQKIELVSSNIGRMDWQSLGRNEFDAKFQGLKIRFMTLVDDQAALANRLIKEVNEWEDTAQHLEGGLVSRIFSVDIRDRNSNGSDDRTDQRVDQRIEVDERWGRKPGGSGGGHLDYDWAGGSILERYLTGGDNWHIKNDPRWTQYMQSNDYLTGDLKERAMNTAVQLYKSGKISLPVNETYGAEIENGEGIVGYQYLHGTNENAGGFQRQGIANMVSDGKGGYYVNMKMTYTWNDIIDPNPQYQTDQWKSRIAETVTLGKADPYDIHITWDENTTVHLDASGNVISIKNQ